MSTKGFVNGKKNGREVFQSMELVRGDKAASLMSPKLPFALSAIAIPITAIDLKANTLEVVAHGASKEDILRVTLGDSIGMELHVARVIDANNVEIIEKLDGLGLNVADEVKPHRVSGQTMDKDGNLVITSGPIKFIRDGVAVEVTEDTVDPANNIPLLVKLASITGDINITANDLNVQLSHTGGNPDSTQIGDGTNLLGINANNEAKTHDAELKTAVEAMSAKLPATLGQKASAASLAAVLSTEQEAKIDLIAREITLAALSAKFNSLGQKASAASAPVVLSTEQEAILEAIKTSNSDISGKIPSLGQKASAGSLPIVMSTEQEAKLDLISREATLAAMSAKLPATLGQKASAASLSAVLSTEQEAKIDLLSKEATLALVAKETTLSALSAKLPATLGQKASAVSLAAVLSTEQEAILSAIKTATESAAGSPVKEVHESIFVASQALTTGADVQVGSAIPVGVTIKEIEIKYEDGTPIEIFATASSVGKIAQGEGKIPVEIVGDNVKVINLRSLGANFTANNLVVNLIK